MKKINCPVEGKDELPQNLSLSQMKATCKLFSQRFGVSPT